MDFFVAMIVPEIDDRVGKDFDNRGWVDHSSTHCSDCIC